jgi:Tfp pilus assembly protein PilV
MTKGRSNSSFVIGHSSFVAGTTSALPTVMHSRPTSHPPPDAGFTIIELLVSAVLIALAVGSIMSMNTQSMHTLRDSHLAAAGSQVLQQRVEMMRALAWPDISNSPALSELMATATESEREMAEANLTEKLTVTVPADTTGPAVNGASSFSLVRHKGVVTGGAAGDFTAQPTLLFEGAVSWTDSTGAHARSLRTVICRDGLTRAGIFGSSLGRAPRSGPSS